MWWTILIPFAIQGLSIILDETLFHVKRGLPVWERRGHPLDTLTVIVCMAYVIWVPFSKVSLTVYLFLSLFSSIFVTKDEFVHKEYCCAKEMWLHALLFTAHPMVLIAAAFIWPVTQGVDVSPWIANWLYEKDRLFTFLCTQFAIMILFLFYQVVFWNFIWKDKPVLKQQ